MRDRTLFAWPVRVYYEDTDAGGVVYHAGYLRFLERARTEFLRARGLVQSRLAAEAGLIFVLTEVALRFRAPARLDDELLVTCVLEERRGASLKFRQELVRATDNRRLVDATVRAACIDAKSFRPKALPDGLVLD